MAQKVKMRLARPKLIITSSARAFADYCTDERILSINQKKQ